jgi:putative alpha-1,2-mannosidase
VIHLANGKQFTTVAHHVSAQNKYIQSAQLNGKPLNKPWFGQSDIANRGTLSWRWRIGRMCNGAALLRPFRLP